MSLMVLCVSAMIGRCPSPPPDFWHHWALVGVLAIVRQWLACHLASRTRELGIFYGFLLISIAVKPMATLQLKRKGRSHELNSQTGRMSMFSPSCIQWQHIRASPTIIPRLVTRRIFREWCSCIFIGALVIGVCDTASLARFTLQLDRI